MEDFNISVKVTAKNQVEAGQVKRAFETMIKNFQAEGIIRMEKIFKSDPFIRNMIKLKLGIKN